jgi:hypothetical protein
MIEIFGLVACLVGSGQWRRLYEQELSLEFFLGQFFWTLLVFAVWTVLRITFMKNSAKSSRVGYVWAQFLMAIATFLLTVGGYCWVFDWPVNQSNDLPDVNTGTGFKIFLVSLVLFLWIAIWQIRRIGVPRRG